jgi:hypothetical protein
MLNRDKIEALRSELGPRARDVAWVDMADVGRNTARIIPAWREFLDEQADRSLRGTGEPIWADRSAAELVECQRHESLLNLAFNAADGFPMTPRHSTTRCWTKRAEAIVTWRSTGSARSAPSSAGWRRLPRHSGSRCPSRTRRYPLRHRKRWRSTNLLERTLGEVKRRTKVIGRFPGEESCLSLVWAVLDLQINNACNGVKLSEIDRRRLYRLRYELTGSEALKKEVAAA